VLHNINAIISASGCAAFSCVLVLPAVRLSSTRRSSKWADPRRRRIEKYRICFACGGLLYFGTMLATRNAILLFVAGILGVALMFISAIGFTRNKS
jgi:hypothetical protein